MTELRVVVPDEIAERLGAEVKDRGTSAEELAAEMLRLHAPAPPAGNRFGFIGLFSGPAEVSVAEAEQRLEDGEYEGFGQ